MKSPTDCQYCKTLRPLTEHLFELSEFCSYLGNSVEYNNGRGKCIVKTAAIGDWLKLASRLENVQINAWAFADSSTVYCGTAADMVDSDSSHFGVYSTALTRFMFVSNALEETYRFAASAYDRLLASQCKGERKLRRASMKAAALINAGLGAEAPKHFEHLIDNYASIFAFYCKRYEPEVSGLNDGSRQSRSFGLHLVRNLRNQVAHGIFPLVDNPAYFGDNGERDSMVQLLLQSCRLSALFIQLFVRDFNNGFESMEYERIASLHGPGYETFLANCTNDYAGRLHLKGTFSFSAAFD